MIHHLVRGSDTVIQILKWLPESFGIEVLISRDAGPAPARCRLFRCEWCDGAVAGASGYCSADCADAHSAYADLGGTGKAGTSFEDIATEAECACNAAAELAGAEVVLG